MKLIRCGMPGNESPGVLLDGIMYDVSGIASDFHPSFFEEHSFDSLRKWVENHRDTLPTFPDDIRLGAPLAHPGKIICIGLNYKKHAAESGIDPPTEPVIFFKATSSITGPNDEIIIPQDSKKTDWEVELGVVIGRKANYVTEAEAMDYVAGYVLHNDVSEREFQLERGGQWVKGKSCDTFAPLGPYLVGKDEIPDPGNVNLWLKVNGKEMQRGSTSDMIFSVAELVSYLSRFMSLLPGDIISTGTPEGVGLGQSPPWYLKPGDEVELGGDQLGIAKQQVVAYSAS